MQSFHKTIPYTQKQKSSEFQNHLDICTKSYYDFKYDFVHMLLKKNARHISASIAVIRGNPHLHTNVHH